MIPPTVALVVFRPELVAVIGAERFLAEMKTTFRVSPNWVARCAADPANR